MAKDFEAQLTSHDAQLQAERAQLTSQKTQLDAERSHLGAQRAQLEADIALLEKARADVEQARAEFDAQVMQAKQAYELFSVQKDTFVEEKTRWEQEGLCPVPHTMCFMLTTRMLILYSTFEDDECASLR